MKRLALALLLFSQPCGAEDWADPGSGGGGPSIAGYGQFNLTTLKVGPDAPYTANTDLRRLVLFVAQPLSKGWSLHLELEWEHAIACRGCSGSAEVEQATLDWEGGANFTVRTGLLLIPMGIINQNHEPTVFHGVERPRFAQVLIPTTWRGLGLGVSGRLSTVDYQVYLTTPMDPSGLGPVGLQGASRQGSNEPGKAPALSFRLDHRPISMLRLGFSGYFSDLGRGGSFFDASGKPAAPFAPLLGLSADLRLRWQGLEFDAVGAVFWNSKVNTLLDLHRADGSTLLPDPSTAGVPATRLQGGYAVFAYDVFAWLGLTQSLLPFVRVEHYDTQAAVPKGHAADPLFAVWETTAGLTWRPSEAVVFKLDSQWRDRKLGLDEHQFNLGVGYAY